MEVDMFGHPVFDGSRSENDYYPTPIRPIDLLLSELNLSGNEMFLEPCRGVARSIYDRVKLKDKQWAELSEGVDYLKTPFYDVDLIITNPPFSIALQFLEKSLSESETVAYLLRMSFLGSQERRPFWQQHPLTHLFPLADRPSFTGNGTDNSEYAWYVWDYAGLFARPPGVHVL